MASQPSDTPVPGSERDPIPGTRAIGPTAADERLEVTIRVRHRTPLPAIETMTTQSPGQRRHLTREEYAHTYGADPEDLREVEAFATQHGLIVLETSIARRSVRLQGTAEAFSKAFGVQLERYEYERGSYRGRTGPVHVPANLTSIIEGVFGLDNRPQARPHVRIRRELQEGAVPQATGFPAGFTPTQVAQLYHFPAGLNGQGQTIGIIELGLPHGSGFRLEELATYFQGLGITPPSIKAVSVDGGQNQPGDDPFDPENADVEVMLDIEVAGAVAPGATIVVYFAPDASDQSFLNAISQAVHDEENSPSVISISWGGPESTSTRQFMNQFDKVLQAAAHLGITVCVAAGDNGSADFPVDDPQRPWDGHAHVDFPASSPFALACGGTHLEGTGTTITSEVVWHEGRNDGTGGGVSRVFALPSYQTATHVPHATNPPGPVGRGVPDVAGNAAQATGYQVLADGQHFPCPPPQQNVPPVGGTSAVAPLWAGLIALFNQQLGHPVGFINPLLYQRATASVFHDITQGNNGDYQAGPGWDPCTGLGSPDGTKLLQAL